MAAKNANANGLHINFFHGDKGGVGKSFLCKSWIDYLLSRNIQVTPIDCDTRNPDIDRLFSPYTDVKMVDLNEEDGWSALFDFIANAQGNIAISLPAGIGNKTDMYGDVFMDAVSQIGAKVTTWWVLGNNYDSVNLLQDAMNKKSPLAQNAIAVRNEFFGEDFLLWQDSATRTEFFKNGGQEVAFPVLIPRIKDVVDRAGVPFSHAATQEVTGINLFTRLALHKWVSSVHTAFDGLKIPLIQMKNQPATAEA